MERESISTTIIAMGMTVTTITVPTGESIILVIVNSKIFKD